jgi:hypothetical protein
MAGRITSRPVTDLVRLHGLFLRHHLAAASRSVWDHSFVWVYARREISRYAAIPPQAIRAERAFGGARLPN